MDTNRHESASLKGCESVAKGKRSAAPGPSWRVSSLEFWRFILVFSAAASLYAASYGGARWRKFIVMREYVVKEERMKVRRTGPGWDVRNNWKGHVKNKLNPAAFYFFWPLCSVEDSLRGSSRRIQVTDE